VNVARRETLGSRGRSVKPSPGGTIEGSVVPPGLDRLLASPDPSTACWATIRTSLRDYQHAKRIRSQSSGTRRTPYVAKFPGEDRGKAAHYMLS